MTPLDQLNVRRVSCRKRVPKNTKNILKVAERESNIGKALRELENLNSVDVRMTKPSILNARQQTASYGNAIFCG